MGLGTCSVRYEGEDGWVETGDSGRIEFSSGRLRAEQRQFAEEGTSAVSHVKNFFAVDQDPPAGPLARRSGRPQPHHLPRGLHRLAAWPAATASIRSRSSSSATTRPTGCGRGPARSVADLREGMGIRMRLASRQPLAVHFSRLQFRTFNKRIPMRTIRYQCLCCSINRLGAPRPMLARAQSNAKEIMARKPAELVEILKNPKASTFEKAKACQRLAVVGTKDAVPALAALLPDENLNCYARCGLEGIADPAADEALRDAAAKLHGRQLVGVIDSIGQRKDVKAVELLAKLLDDKDRPWPRPPPGPWDGSATREAGRSLLKAVAADSPAKTAAADAVL